MGGLLCLSCFQITLREIWTWHQDGNNLHKPLQGQLQSLGGVGQPPELLIISFLISVSTVSGNRAGGLGREHRARDRNKQVKAVQGTVQSAPHSTFRYLVKRLYNTRSVDFRSQLTMSA